MQGVSHSPVAVQAHGGECKDGGVHGEEVQAQEEAAARLTKGPARRQAVVHDEGGGEKVEQVGKCEAQHLEVKRGGGGRRRGDGGGGGGGGVGEAEWYRYSHQAAGWPCCASSPVPPALQKEA